MLKGYADENVIAPVFFWPQQRRESPGDLANRILIEASGHDYAAACSRVFFF